MGLFSRKLRSAAPALGYDDVLLKPRFSDIVPREDVDLSTKISRNVRLGIPIVSSPMDTVTESEMAIALAELGGIGVIHRNMSIERQVKEVKAVKERGLIVGAAVGVFDEKRVKELINVGADLIVIDAAHGHSRNVLESLRIYKRLGDVDVVAGNIVTAEAAEDLISAGADGLRVGMGSGSICITREVSGVGVPQLSAVAWVSDVASNYGVPVIADGGVKRIGDIVKAIAAGADCVMLGSMLAGTDEAPGELIEKDGFKFKRYRGMGSREVIYRLDRYSKLVPEGVSSLIPYKGSVRKILKNIIGGLKSGFGYIGARSVDEVKIKGEFVLATRSERWEMRSRNILVERSSIEGLTIG